MSIIHSDMLMSRFFSFFFLLPYHRFSSCFLSFENQIKNHHHRLCDCAFLVTSPPYQLPQKQSLFERLMGSMARTGSNKGSLAHPHSHSHPNSNSGSTTITTAPATTAANHGSVNNGKGEEKETKSQTGVTSESSTASKTQPSAYRYSFINALLE